MSFTSKSTSSALFKLTKLPCIFISIRKSQMFVVVLNIFLFLITWNAPIHSFSYFLLAVICGKSCYLQFCLSIYSHSDSIWNKYTTWSKQQQCHAGSPCLSFCNHPIWQDWTQAGQDSGFYCNIQQCKFPQQLLFQVCSLFGLLNCNCLFSGFGERGFRHSQSNSYHPHGTHCGLLSEDQTASQMLSSASWCHGQEWVHAGKICYFCITFLLFMSFVYICEGYQSSRSW